MKSALLTSLVTYFKESLQELRRVTWLTHNQAIRLSAIVLGCVLVSSVFIAALDFAFNRGYAYLLTLK